MKNKRILVIEDEAAIRRGIVDALKFDGYEVLEASRGDKGLQAALNSDCNFVLLDLVMPGMRGLDVLEEIRKHRPSLPIIILTALGAEADRVKGLKLGADDYVVKPFSIKELLARVEVVLRRSPERTSNITHLSIESGTVSFERCEVRFDGGEIKKLSERETELLKYLANNAGRIISREELLQRVWRLDPRGISTRTIDMHIARLREKLHDDSEKPKVITTMHGKGYMFATDKASDHEGHTQQ